MSAKCVELATRTFKTQSEATLFFKEILNRYRHRERLTEGDEIEVLALLVRHPEYKAKVGCGVDHIEVRITEHGTIGFYIVRNDGSGTDFSYYSCVRGSQPAAKTEVSRAFRWAVRRDIARARDAFLVDHKGEDGLYACFATKERLTPNDGHMDHVPPMTFEVIVASFLAARGLSAEEVPITKGADNQVNPEIADVSLADAFKQYHQRVATLDFVKTSVNLTQGGRNRLKKTRVKIPAALSAGVLSHAD